MIEHNTPKLEERLAEMESILKDYTLELNSITTNRNNVIKNINSCKLALNEINLLKNIRDGKYVILDLDKMEFLKTKWV